MYHAPRTLGQGGSLGSHGDTDGRCGRAPDALARRAQDSRRRHAPDYPSHTHWPCRGCRHHCRGCFNPETWDFNYGKPFTGEVLDTLLRACNHDFIDGLSLLGGEPFEPENQPELLHVVQKCKELYPGKTVWCYTGYTWEQVMQQPRLLQAVKELDVLVDSPFVMAERDTHLRFRGSRNQRLIDVQATLATGKVTQWHD